MSRSLVLGITLLAIGIFKSNAQVGTKGGHYQPYQQHHHQLPHSQPANQTGYCYKRVPYHQAESLFNRSGSHIDDGYHQGARPQWNNTHNIHNNYGNNNDNNGWVSILDCCDGYMKNRHTNSCEIANCEGNCFGGRCRGDVCICDPGWIPIDGVCKPICRQPCGINAYCFSPETCRCRNGWEKSPSGDCRPICAGGCINGDCVAFNTCRCKPGYTMNEMTQQCVPDCEEGCGNGRCIGPGVCRCDQGYYDPEGYGKRCLPYCGPNNCGYGGICESPGVCQCRSGYTKNSYTQMCEPTVTSSNNGNYQTQNQDCDRPCINGVCMGFNICSCKNGYTPDPADPTRTRCISACPNGCPNGVCTGPNHCLCLPGYVKDRSVKGSQICILRNNY